MRQPELSDKPFAIPKQAVVEAFRKVRANQGGPGVDGCTIEEYESDLRNRLYVTWNRMSSGSYFPPPVKAVAVPKPHGGGVRMLGVPTVADRVAQTVVASELEKVVERKFHSQLVRVPAGAVRVGCGSGMPGALFHALVGVGL